MRNKCLRILKGRDGDWMSRGMGIIILMGKEVPAYMSWDEEMGDAAEMGNANANGMGRGDAVRKRDTYWIRKVLYDVI